MRWFFLLILLASWSVSASEATWCSNHVYRKQDLAWVKQIRISNNLNHYRLDFQLSKPNTMHGKAPSFMILMREPSQKFGFSAPLWNFMHISVNDIPISCLDVKETDFSLWKKDDAAGVDLALNFDGVKMILRFFMRDDSPVLWGMLENKNSLSVSGTSVQFYAIPSFLPGSRLEGGYGRFAITPARTVGMSRRDVSLTPDDKYLLLGDEKYKLPDVKNSAGPCLLAFSYDELAFASLSMPDSYMSKISVTLKNDFKCFKFGLWETEGIYTNQEAAEYIGKNPERFRLKENRVNEK